MRFHDDLFVLRFATESDHPVVELFDWFHALVIPNYILLKPFVLLFVTFEIVVKVSLFPFINIFLYVAISVAEH